MVPSVGEVNALAQTSKFMEYPRTAVSTPAIPRTNLPVPLEALPRSAEELVAVTAKTLGAKVKRDPTALRALVSVYRSSAVFVCNALDKHGAKPSTVVERFLTLLGVDPVTAFPTYAASTRQSDGRYTREYIVYVADLSKRFGHEPGTDISVLTVNRRYQRCWYGTFLSFNDVGVSPDYGTAQAGPADA
jgi:hypothetical protein